MCMWQRFTHGAAIDIDNSLYKNTGTRLSKAVFVVRCKMFVVRCFSDLFVNFEHLIITRFSKITCSKSTWTIYPSK